MTRLEIAGGSPKKAGALAALKHHLKNGAKRSDFVVKKTKNRSGGFGYTLFRKVR